MPLSRSAVDKLGERLRTGAVTGADWTLLEELRAERQRQLAAVVQVLRSDLGVEVTSRVKTTNTLVEKLRRERMRLSQMDDVAGLRIKISGTRTDQDAIVAKLLSRWPEARRKDRREAPVHGYRAVHVIPMIDGWPLEIQIRTARQDAVANLLEALADRWGRQIRYGGLPDDASRPLKGLAASTRTEILNDVFEAASAVAETERYRAWMLAQPTAPPDALQALDNMEESLDRWLSSLDRLIELLGE